MPNDLSLLLCGKPRPVSEGGSELDEILAHIRESIDYLMGQLSWLGAQEMLGAVQEKGAWLADLAAYNMDLFISRKRNEIGRLYSSLSKGIHHEFVMPPSVLYDRSTVVDLVLSTVRQVADLGLVSHFIAHAASTLSPEEALATFNRIETVEVIK